MPHPSVAAVETKLSASPSLIPLVVSEASRMRCDLLAEALSAQQSRFCVLARPISVRELIESSTLNPAVAIISADLDEGHLTGFGALRQLRASHPSIRGIMLLDNCDRDLVVAAFRGGACGVFSRGSSIEEFTKCIEQVHQGQVWAGPSELLFIIEALSTVAPLRYLPPETRIPLTRREQQIALKVAAGAPERDICRQLNISEHNLKTHLARVYEKLGIRNRVELVLCLPSKQVRGAVPGHAIGAAGGTSLSRAA